MKVLVINAGSSSLKYQVFDMQNKEMIVKGLCERIGIGGHLKQQAHNREAFEIDIDIPDHNCAVDMALKYLVDKEIGPLSDISEIEAVGHRIPHGGEKFSDAVLIDPQIIEHIESVAHFTPLHSPPILTCMRACMKKLENIPHVGVFDTAFHHTIPKEAFLYAIPYEYYEVDKIRRYGFHGTSHRFVCMQASQYLGKPLNELKIISCHLGNGSSIAAVKYGKSIDNSMGFTPLEGLPMGTRSGDIDPAIIENIASFGNKTCAQVVSLLNTRSGLLGISGISSDFRDIEKAAGEGNERATIAIEVLAYRIKKYIGAYFAAMDGADALIFTAGIGENSALLRKLVCYRMSALGITIDENKNRDANGFCEISDDKSRMRILVVPTNEEWMIACDTQRLTGKY